MKQTVYTAPESNTTLKLAPWYERSGAIASSNGGSDNYTTTTTSIDKIEQQQAAAEKRATKFAALPFTNDIVKSQSALQQSFLVSVTGGLFMSGYRYYKMRTQPLAVPRNRMVKFTSLMLGYMYGSSVTFLSSYLFLRYRELKMEEQIKQTMGAMYPNDRTRQQQNE